MNVFLPRENLPAETRVPVLPETVKKLAGLGAEFEIEPGLGAAVHIADEAYRDAGAAVNGDRSAALRTADMVLRLRPPPAEDVDRLTEGCVHVGLLDPFRNLPLVRRLAERKISAVCMELIPRTTLAQKMDALSSQANLAGYAAVILAAERLNKIFPMMMTPAGTIVPARVFIIGAGVAGLQAIATARRLGGRVEAYDTRPVVREQVESLGAKFVQVEIGETGETRDGYAKALSDEQLGAQRRAMAKHCAQADVVITTAQVFGRTAPRIVTADMIRGMKPGSVVVDLAVETGGNVEGAVLDQEIETDGVRIVGLGNLPGRVALDASRMYSSNLGALVEHFWHQEDKRLNLDLEDAIMKGCLLTHAGQILNGAIAARAREAV